MSSVKTDELTRTLIDEAARIYDEQGPAALTLRRLALASSTSTMAVYTRFGDKQGLLSAMYREAFRRFGVSLEQASAADHADSLARLAAIGRAYRAAALAAPHLYGLMFGRRPVDIVIEPADEAAALGTFAAVEHGAQQIIDDKLAAGNANTIALHLWTVVHGAVALEIAGLDRVGRGDTTAAADEAFEQTLFLAIAPFLINAP